MRKALTVLSCLLFPALAMAQVIPVNSPPVADAGADQVILTGTTTRLDGVATDADGDTIVAWLWTVDAAPSGSSPAIEWPDEPDPLFITNTPGSYVLALAAFDGIDWSEADFVTVDVRDLLAPEAVVDANVISGPAPLAVQLDGSSSFVDPFAGPLTYTWSFGDGDFGAGSTAAHTYTLPGTYLATLTVVDALGQSDQDILEITATAPNNAPTASPTATPNSGTAPLIVQFNANATDPEGDDLTYLWDFGDPGTDNTSTLANPGHVYEAPGAYTVWLTVSDGQEEITMSLVVVVSTGQALSTRKASVVKWLLGRSEKGTVSYWADIDLAIPGPDDVISLSFDGVKLFTKPFSEFKQGRDPDVFLLVKRRLLVRINFAQGRIYVLKRKVNLKKFDNADGVDIELMWGNEMAVDQFVMTKTTDRVWTYTRDDA